MPTIWTSRTRTQQPSGIADPAWTNALTRGTATGLLPIDGGVYETARRAVRVPYAYGTGNDLGIRAGSGMRSASQIAATKDFWDLEPSAPDPTTGPYCAPSLEFTFLVLCKRFGNPVGGAPIFGNLAPSISPYYCWGVANSGGSIEVFLNCAGTFYSTPSTPLDSGLNCIVARRRVVGGTSDAEVWINSTLRSTQAVGTGAISYFAAGSTRGAALGNYYKYTGDTRSFNGEIYLAWLWARALSDGEIRSVSRAPWQLFAPVRKPVFYSLAGGVYSVSLSESATASDAMAASGALAAALTEAATASNTITAAAVFASALVEAATASESNSATTTRAGSLAESVTAGDAMLATTTLAGALAEAASASDAVSSIATMAVALSEAASASDSIDGAVGAATYSATLTEAASASDSFSAAAVIAGAIVEAVTAGDTVAAIATFAAAITESASASDAVSGARVMAAAISEAATASDAWTGTTGAAVLTAALAESVLAGDVFTALDILARMGIRGAAGVARQAHMRHAQIQAARRRN